MRRQQDGYEIKPGEERRLLGGRSQQAPLPPGATPELRGKCKQGDMQGAVMVRYREGVMAHLHAVELSLAGHDEGLKLGKMRFRLNQQI